MLLRNRMVHCVHCITKCGQALVVLSDSFHHAGHDSVTPGSEKLECTPGRRTHGRVELLLEQGPGAMEARFDVVFADLETLGCFRGTQSCNFTEHEDRSVVVGYGVKGSLQ